MVNQLRRQIADLSLLHRQMAPYNILCQAVAESLAVMRRRALRLDELSGETDRWWATRGDRMPPSWRSAKAPDGVRPACKKATPFRVPDRRSHRADLAGRRQLHPSASNGVPITPEVSTTPGPLRSLHLLTTKVIDNHFRSERSRCIKSPRRITFQTECFQHGGNHDQPNPPTDIWFQRNDRS